MALRECKQLRMTDREIEVAYLFAKGYTNRRIARELSLSVNTVKSHTRRIYYRLGIDGAGASDDRGRAKRFVAQDRLRGMGL